MTTSVNPILIPLIFPDHVPTNEISSNNSHLNQNLSSDDDDLFPLLSSSRKQHLVKHGAHDTSSTSESSNTTNNRIPHWAMIEINGELMTPKNTLSIGCHNSNDGPDDTILPSSHLELGSVYFMNEKEPIMIIGSHELKGTIVPLKQPFCVLQKKKNVELKQKKPSIIMEDQQQHQPSNILPPNDTTSTTTTQYNVIGLVTSKLLFDKYPKTIVRQSL
jgi:Ctf8